MDQKLQNFIQELNEEQKLLLDSYIKDSNLDLEKMKINDIVTGNLESWCRPPGQRPLWNGWNEFTLTTVINDGDDWTFFGTTKDDRNHRYSFVIDVLKSTNVFEVRIGGFYPWRANLNDTNAVSYRTSRNKIVIRAVSVVGSQHSYCKLSGMIAAEISVLESVEKVSIEVEE